MRTFIAVDLPPELLIKIGDIVTFFQEKTPPKGLKWVETENLHLTVKFIGEVTETKAEHIKKVLKQYLANQPAFEIEISGLGMYPNKHMPRVIWLGINHAEPLDEIHKTLDRSLQMLGIEPEGRPFTPHLTIARVRRNTDKATTKLIGQTLSQFKVDVLGTAKIDRVCLYQSVLTPSGPVYTNMLTVALNQV